MQMLAESEVRKLLAAPDRIKRQIARTLSELLQYNTENPPVESYDIQRYIRDELIQAGITCRLHHPGDNAVALTSSIGSNRAAGLTLYGHVDVVPAGDKSKWRYPPYAGKIVGDRIYGRGASDMKSGVAALLYAYRLLYENGVQIPGRLEFVSVLDEENWHRTPAGWNTTDWLLRTERLRGKACIMAEPSSVSKLCIGERGDFWIRLTSLGAPTHGSRPVYADNASVKLFQCLDEIHRSTRQRVKAPKEIQPVLKRSYRILGEEFGKAKGDRLGDEEGGLLEHYSMNVGTVSGGTMINVVPENCQADIAFCVPLGATRRQLNEKIRGILRKRQYSGIKLSYLGESQSDPTYTPPDSGIVTTLSGAVRRITGSYPSVYVTQGTSDGNIFRKHRVHTCFYGPGTFETIHGYNESVSIRDTVTAAKVYLLAIIKFFRLDTKRAN